MLETAHEYFRIEKFDLVFGSKPKKAFISLDQGKNRDQIYKETGQLVAVHQANLSIYRGEILVIMGMSGSGKSSLLRSLNGMNGRTKDSIRGSIIYQDPDMKDKVDISRCSLKELRMIRKYKISMVFQQFGLMPWKTVEENVAYPLEIQGVPKEESAERVAEKLALVGLKDSKSRYPHELSGGMQQRVGLARAFITNAEVLLMDEPFSALDPFHRKSLQDEVVQLQRKLKKTIVFVTHDLSEAARIGTRIAILDAGRLLQVDTPDQLMAKPQCDQTKKFVSQLHH